MNKLDFSKTYQVDVLDRTTGTTKTCSVDLHGLREFLVESGCMETLADDAARVMMACILIPECRQEAGLEISDDFIEQYLLNSDLQLTSEPEETA